MIGNRFDPTTRRHTIRNSSARFALTAIAALSISLTGIGLAAAKPAAPGPVTTQPAAPDRSAGGATQRHIVWVDTGSATLDEYCNMMADGAAESSTDQGAAALVDIANKAGCDMAIA